jgi:hypothetical protein
MTVLVTLPAKPFKVVRVTSPPIFISLVMGLCAFTLFTVFTDTTRTKPALLPKALPKGRFQKFFVGHASIYADPMKNLFVLKIQK